MEPIIDQMKPTYALVTGASRGIGAACAKELAKRNYHVLINYRTDVDAANMVKSSIETAGGSATLLPFDVGNRELTRQTLEAWMTEEERHIEVLVNNAGMRMDNSLLWMEDKEWDDVLQVHLQGFYNVTKTVLKPMVLKKFGRIINVVSLSGISGMAGQTNYSAAKAAVIGATKALAQETAKRKVTVNCVAPGFIDTDMTSDLDKDLMKQRIPMRRFGQPEEVAACVGFLSSKGASYITGEVISINGGLYT